ncbi:MAG: gliding motility-associated ABC transporter ATP-binding subunit GldA [Cyclobacteriaceae bacterium]|nr:gliding motility-associated ABC transporter ATP-binding subunit GldA [Cyclobacteriaceae bacterium]
MSLLIQNLTRLFGNQKAVDDISFSVNRGEIVGFLGPNGAGKSTTMKIATTFLPPSSGKLIVEGFNVTENAMAVKRITGYLPEHNPLYTDMFVHEYLRFIGGLYGLRGKILRTRVSEMIDQCGLTREQHKKIESLSKGYRQRVGLAQALIHDPKVLILDEPTSGLDPNQLLEIRKLIKEISKNKTVLFSTHIMQEVQALCDRVVVINQGKIVADDSLSNLISQKEKEQVVRVEFENKLNADSLRSISGVHEVEIINDHTFRIISFQKTDIRPELFRFASETNNTLIGLHLEASSLEDIFRTLTHKQAEA